MVAILCTVQVPCDTGLPEDTIHMTRVYNAIDSTGPTLDAILDAEFDFWNTNPGDVGYGAPGGTLANAWADSVVGATWGFDFHLINLVTGDLTFLRHDAGTVTLGASSDPLTAETAIRLTAHGVLTGGEGDREKRGGFFFGGGLRRDVCATIQGGALRVAPDIRIRLRSASRQLLDDGAASAGTFAWAIWSRTAAQTTAVIGGWVDNAFDTIRKRGPAPTVRESWTVSP